MESKELISVGMDTLKRTLESSPELPKQSKCSRCASEFYLLQGEADYDIYGKVVIRQKHCRTCRPIVEKEQEEARKKRCEEAKGRRLGSVDGIMANIFPKKFSLLASLHSLSEAFMPFVPPCGRGLCLTGRSGVGKTTSMALIAKEYFLRQAADCDRWQEKILMERDVEKSWMFISYPEFIMRLQGSFRKDDQETPYDMLDQVARVPFLVIDDLGAEKPTDFVRQATYFLVNKREMDMRLTFITTNFGMDELDKSIDCRIASRIAGMCDVVELKGKDRRIKAVLA